MVELRVLAEDPGVILRVFVADGERCDERGVVDLEFADGERCDERGVVDLEFADGERCGERGVIDLEFADGERCDERGVVDLEFLGGGVRVEGLSIGLLMVLVGSRCLDKHEVNDW